MRIGQLAFAAASLGAAVATSDTLARAQTDDPCLITPVEGQKLRKAGKLLDARARFAVCSRDTCPSEIVAACVRWKTEVEGAIPSVVLAARDDQGHDLTDVRVSIDGSAPVELGARAIELDPGTRRFVFQRAHHADIEQQVVLREGEKNRPILAVFPTPAITPTTAAPLPTTKEQVTRERPTPASVWIVGGVSVAAFATFATFGALGVNARNSNHCDTGCTQAQADASGYEQKLRIADISLGVGVVALGIATWLYVSRPSALPRAAAWIDVHPTPGGGVGMIGSQF